MQFFVNLKYYHQYPFAKNWINLMIAYDHITINNHTKHDIMIVFAFFVSFPDIDQKARYSQATTSAIVKTVHKNAVVPANVISWKSHRTVGFGSDFLIHSNL